MEFQIEGNPDYGHLVVSLGPGDKFLAEGGSMAWMSDGVDVKARLLGGFLPALVRKVTGGESLFVGEYTHPAGGEVVFSPRVPGHIGHRSLADDSLILTGGSYMASTPGINLRTRFGGLKALFSGEGLFLMECTGQGDLFFNTYGALSREGGRGRIHRRYRPRGRVGAHRQLHDTRHGWPEEHADVGRGSGDALHRTRQSIPSDQDSRLSRQLAHTVPAAVIGTGGGDSLSLAGTVFTLTPGSSPGQALALSLRERGLQTP